jgi:ring-1,2-phenylacetyl-CoA epoxidase subunit PaaB
MLKSLDPRVNRLNLPEETPASSKEGLDQLPTFEVFVQAKEGRPFQHEGIVHAADEEMAFLFANEQFSRRNTCSGIWVVKTENVHTTPFTDGDRNIYDEIPSDRRED